MPQAIIPAVVGAGISLIGQNAQNHANQQAATNAQNSAEAFQAQQQQQAFQQLQQQRQQAMTALQQYLSQHPNPVNSWGSIVGPNNSAPSVIGGGTVGSMGQRAPMMGMQQ